MRKLALVEDTIRECDLILQMRKSANKLIENREMVKDLEAEILESRENAYNDIKAGLVGIYNTNHLEKALERARAESSAIEAEHLPRPRRVKVPRTLQCTLQTNVVYYKEYSTIPNHEIII